MQKKYAANSASLSIAKVDQKGDNHAKQTWCEHLIKLTLQFNCTKIIIKSSVEVNNVHKKSAIDYTVKGCSFV